jgi:hypothetical protein
LHVVIKGLELGFNALGVGIFAVLETIPKSVDFVINSAKASINGLIEGLNKLPKVEIDKMVIGQSKASQVMEDFRVSAVEEFAQTKAELDALAMKPMPSTMWEKFVEDAQKASTEAAQAIVSARQKAIEIPIGADPKNDSLVKYSDKTQEQLTAMYARGTRDRVSMSSKESNDLAKVQSAFGSESLSAYSQMFGNISSLMESENKKQFEIGKKAAAAQAIIDTIASAQSAFKSLTGIPVVGPALGIAAAGAATIAGMARLSQINSTSFGGGGSVPSSPSTGGMSTGSASGVTQGQAGVGAVNNQTLVVEGISDDMLLSGSMVRSLASKLVDFQKDGGEVVIA